MKPIIEFINECVRLMSKPKKKYERKYSIVAAIRPDGDFWISKNVPEGEEASSILRLAKVEVEPRQDVVRFQSMKYFDEDLEGPPSISELADFRRYYCTVILFKKIQTMYGMEYFFTPPPRRSWWTRIRSWFGGKNEI